MLDQAQLDQFHRDGFLRLRQVVGGDELELLRLAADRVQADGLAGRGEHHYRPGGGTPLYWRSDRVWERDPIFAATTAHPHLLQAVGQCLGHGFLPVADAFICAQRFGGQPESWRQEVPYADPQRRCTLGIPHFSACLFLDQATAENGCWWALPGRHLAGHLALEEEDAEALFAQARPLELAAGDVLLLAAPAPRASRGNTSARSWRAFEIHYLAAQVLASTFAHPPFPERGFNTQGLRLAAEFAALRRTLGLVFPADPQVPLGEEGFVPAGPPTTPPYHWRNLAGQASR